MIGIENAEVEYIQRCVLHCDISKYTVVNIALDQHILCENDSI